MIGQWIGAHIKETLSEPNGGTLSWGRVASTFNALVAAVCIVYYMCVHKQMPDFGGITTYILGPYGMAKGSAVITAFKKDSPTP